MSCLLIFYMKWCENHVGEELQVSTSKTGYLAWIWEGTNCAFLLRCSPVHLWQRLMLIINSSTIKAILHTGPLYMLYPCSVFPLFHWMLHNMCQFIWVLTIMSHQISLILFLEQIVSYWPTSHSNSCLYRFGWGWVTSRLICWHCWAFGSICLHCWVISCLYQRLPPLI